MTHPAAASPVLFAVVPSSERASRHGDYTAEVSLDADALRASVVDARGEIRQAFADLPAVERTRLAEDAWYLGLRCVISSHRAAAESRLEDVGQQLFATFEKQLAAHQDQQHAGLARMMGDYFDPKAGRVPARLEELLRDDGLLARTMGRYLAPDGELAKVLARAVGESSPVMQRLSPTETQGVVQMIEARVRAALTDGSSQLARALDPTVDNSAIRRFFSELGEEMRKVDDDRGKQLAVVTKALDGNDPASAMSKLVRDTQAASQQFLRAINGDDPGSALGGIKTTLVALVEKQGKAQLEALATLDERQRREALETREAIARLEERRRQEARSPRGGALFESALGETLQNLLGSAPALLDVTGARPGKQKPSKIGDFVVKFTEESAFAGSGVVVEAKHDAAYTVAQARDEMKLARANREVGVGLFVMARSHAASGFPAYARHGRDVLVIWDETDPATDHVLWSALQLALCLAAEVQRTGDAGNLDALHDIEDRLGKEVARIEKMRIVAERMRKDADTMLGLVAAGAKGLDGLVGDAKNTLLALNVKLADAQAMLDEPIGLPELRSAAAA